MSQEDPYDLKPQEKKASPKPGDPDWVEPVPIVEKADPVAESEPVDPDITNNKAMAILAYVFFVIPLIAAPQSKFARYHANQGLLVFGLWVVAVIGVVALEALKWILAYTPVHGIWILYAFFSCLASILQVGMLIGVLALAISGIVRAANGEYRGLPLIGHWTFIK